MESYRQRHQIGAKIVPCRIKKVSRCYPRIDWLSGNFGTHTIAVNLPR